MGSDLNRLTLRADPENSRRGMTSILALAVCGSTAVRRSCAQTRTELRLQISIRARQDVENVQNRGMSGRRATDEQLRIIKFWWLLELFSPQKIPAPKRLSPSSPDEQVILWRPGDALPWDSHQPPAKRGSTTRVWSHTVYLGVYSLADIYEYLHEVFHDDDDVHDQRQPGDSACAGLLIDSRGQLVNDSQVLSSALWATGRAGKRGPSDPRWADGFDNASSLFSKTAKAREDQRIETFHKADKPSTSSDEDETPPPPPIDGDFLEELLNVSHRCAEVVGLTGLATDEIRIESKVVSARRADEPPESDFLNSFFLKDLATVRDQAANNALGEALDRYLSPDGTLPLRHRVDVREEPSAVDAVVSADHMPKSRWPTDPAHHLALSQQFAVNRALGDFAGARGILGVNGPPGTGKTTMLRDVLAGNVVERARRLGALPRPTDAFTDTVHKWKTEGEYECTVPQLRPELTGFEMIVASANNSAVENISFEIPATEAIAEQWHDSADYFSEIATFLLQRDSKSQSSKTTTSAWGTVAARLGNKRNRASFRSDFWFGERDPKTRKLLEGGCPGLNEELRRRQNDRAQWPTWAEAKNAFFQAEKRVDALIANAKSAEDRLAQLAPARVNVQRLQQRLEHNQRQLHEVEQSLGKCMQDERAAAARRDHAFAGYSQHLADKPGFFEIVFTFGRALRPWRTALNEFSRIYLATEEHLNNVIRQREQLQLAFHDKAQNLTHTESDLDRARTDLNELSTQCRDDEMKYGCAYPGEEWTGEKRELQAPWLTEELDKARSELFLAALKLHENFMVAAGDTLRKGLHAALSVVGSDHPATLQPEKILASWQLFFLAVPLVSTTFASAGRMFEKLGKDSLGWLFIDEAGQASPQYAVGSIWRSKRVIAVGDPLQLPPVVTIPNKAKGDIARTLGVSDSWCPPEASVQTLADRISVYGTRLAQSDEDVWVSAPLRVHRRCDDPMFTISNDLAYEGIMVKGADDRIDELGEPNCFDVSDGFRIFPSFWADESATVSGTHLQPNQISRLCDALDYLQKMGIEPSKVIAISPFRAVADKLRSLKSHYPGLTAGTIHTAQGREAPVVFFVLGGAPDRPGARKWAAQTVNLVNVAVSRAQRRLFVIGDESAWSKNNYFRELSRSLGRHRAAATPSRAAQAEKRPEHHQVPVFDRDSSA
jgi:hypothetical protein